MLSPQVQTLVEACGLWVKNEREKSRPSTKLINHLCPSKNNTEHRLFNLYMLADGDVYENKLYKHTKKLRNLTFKTSPVSYLLCNQTDMLWTKRTSDVGNAEKRFIHNELQSSAGEHDGQISSTFYWFDCDIADSSLPPTYNRLI